MVKAVLCPVCGGSGKVPDPSNEITTACDSNWRICHDCNGKGWVEVSDK